MRRRPLGAFMVVIALLSTLLTSPSGAAEHNASRPTITLDGDVTLQIDGPARVDIDTTPSEEPFTRDDFVVTAHGEDPLYWALYGNCGSPVCMIAEYIGVAENEALESLTVFPNQAVGEMTTFVAIASAPAAVKIEGRSSADPSTIALVTDPSIGSIHRAPRTCMLSLCGPLERDSATQDSETPADVSILAVATSPTDRPSPMGIRACFSTSDPGCPEDQDDYVIGVTNIIQMVRRGHVTAQSFTYAYEVIGTTQESRVALYAIILPMQE
jgi:hypothetical protein